MTKFSNIENADFKKIVRILTSMMQNADTKVKSNWSVEALKKRGALTFTYAVSPVYNHYDMLNPSFLIQLSVLQRP